MRKAWQSVRRSSALAKAGRMNGCLIEGMGCPGGCIAGAGTQYPGSKSEEKSCYICKEFQQADTSEGARGRSS